MKVKVIQEFNDKHSGIVHRIGEELDLPVKRINEIMKVGGVVEIIETEQETEHVEPVEATEEVPVVSAEADVLQEEQPAEQPEGNVHENENHAGNVEEQTSQKEQPAKTSGRRKRK